MNLLVCFSQLAFSELCIAARFCHFGIRFIAINDNYDNANTESSDSDSIVVPFKNLLNDSYCRDISIKVRSQLDIKRRKGEFIGGYAVYGYSKDEQNKNRLVVDEYAADIVRSIYRRKLEGMSANSIADQLNSEGVLAPSEYKRLCGLNYHSGFKTGTHAKWQAIQVLRMDNIHCWVLPCFQSVLHAAGTAGLSRPAVYRHFNSRKNSSYARTGCCDRLNYRGFR